MMLIGGPKGGDDEEKSSLFGKKSEESEGGPSLMGMGRKRYAKDIMRALEGGDVGAFDKALYAYLEACQGEEE